MSLQNKAKNHEVYDLMLKDAASNGGLNVKDYRVKFGNVVAATTSARLQRNVEVVKVTISHSNVRIFTCAVKAALFKKEVAPTLLEYQRARISENRKKLSLNLGNVKDLKAPTTDNIEYPPGLKITKVGVTYINQPWSPPVMISTRDNANQFKSIKSIGF